MPFYEITTSWAIPSGIPTKTYTYWQSTASLDILRARLGVFWDSIESVLSSQIFWSVDPTGKELDPASGALLAEWSEGTVVAGQGSGGAQPVADATQINCQWNTGVVVGGRFLKGRSYIPGASSAALSNGNLNGAQRTAVNVAAQALADADLGFSVWHRPVNGFGGSQHPVTTATVRSELAVLRKRRNRSS